MKKRPLIGIVAWSTGENSFGVTKPYLNHLSHFGDTIILTPQRGIVDNLDLIVLPGGKDMASVKYGAVPGYYNSDPDQYKEFFVENNLQQYIDAGVPIWGTCLGFQQLGVFFGSIMCQNIDLFSHGHSEVYGKGREDLVNDLVFTPEFLLLESKLLAKINKNKTHKSKKSKIQVCSLHHQAIYDEDLSDELDLIAKTDDGIVECFKHKTLPIAAGQFHVEEDGNILANYLISELLKQSPNFEYEDKGVQQQGNS